MAERIGKVLLSEEQIRERAKELAKQIDEDYKGEEICLVGTLKGSIVWMADLMKELKTNCSIDFVIASSYGSGTSTSGVVSIKKDIETDIYNKHVLIVEDIVDTGTTLKFLKQHLAERNPKSIKVCSLLNKPDRRIVPFEAEYVGFDIPNLFVIGYGLDYDQKYRDLPYVGYLEG